MSHTIKGFQDDEAVLLSERIKERTGEFVDPIRILAILVKHGVVSDYTKWRKMDSVLGDLGFDFDEIFEVA